MINKFFVAFSSLFSIWCSWLVATSGGLTDWFFYYNIFFAVTHIYVVQAHINCLANDGSHWAIRNWRPIGLTKRTRRLCVEVFVLSKIHELIYFRDILDEGDIPTELMKIHTLLGNGFTIRQVVDFYLDNVYQYAKNVKILLKCFGHVNNATIQDVNYIMDRYKQRLDIYSQDEKIKNMYDEAKKLITKKLLQSI